MAVAFIQEFRIQDGDRSTTNYDAISERLDARSDWPDGCIIHTAGFDDEAGVFRIFEVWESREQCERFLQERVMPLVQELTGGQAPPPDRQATYDLHDYAAR
jgi:quinol monooxygenase YgiN